MKTWKNSFLFMLISILSFIIFSGVSVFQSTSIDQTTTIKEKQTKIINRNYNKYSAKPLGAIVNNNVTTFRLFAPNALKVFLITFDDYNDDSGNAFEMKVDKDGTWEHTIEDNLSNKYYGYKVFHNDNDELDSLPLCIDPYAKAVATYNTYMNPRKSIVYNEEYNWDDDEWIQRDWKDLIIYEMHVRDITAHQSSGAKNPGQYKGLTEKNIKGGLPYIKSLGVNTIELLPAMEFGTMEIPFEDSLSGKFNSWNPYERNHWGYMTSNFFAPAAYYSENWKNFKRDEWMGTDGSQVNEFKDMVKTFHKEGIGVVMDVVYNHLSEYEIGNLKQIDKEYYFRLDENGNFIAESYCGNDLKTESPMMRRMIVESVLYWMKEYHIDGFRFDLGKLIDWETIEEIIHEARKINPNVVFVCEPWGGGYDPEGFSLRDWGAWNDQIRNGIKGENPIDGLGWIFGNWYGNNSQQRIKSYVNGTLVRDQHGLFHRKEHSVNYLESHDGYTLGDFIRIGTNSVKHDSIITDVDKNILLNEEQLRLNKLGALFLFTSQGITMIHSGQEFARSKVVPLDIEIQDEHKGMIDHNSYNKDNETNYINYNHADLNHELLDYYRGLIQLRSTFDAFRRADYDNIVFFEDVKSEFALGYRLTYNGDTFLVLFNANPDTEEAFNLPEGKWNVLVNHKKAGIEILGNVVKEITLPSSSGVVLKLN